MNNQDFLILKRRLSDIGLDPADIWKDTTGFQQPLYDKIVAELDDMLVKTKGSALRTIEPYKVALASLKDNPYNYSSLKVMSPAPQIAP